MPDKPRTERGRASRERIVERAAELFAERGVTATSLDEVLAAAGAGKSQLYHYFRGRDELVAAAVGLRCAQVLAGLTQALGTASSLADLEQALAGFDAIAADGHHRALYLLKELGLCGNEDAASCPAARHVARSWLAPWLRHPTSCFSTSRPITWTCPASSGWSANWPNCARASS